MNCRTCSIIQTEVGWKGTDTIQTLKTRTFTRAKQLLDRGTWLKHPWVILHELAHAYHDQILGFEHPEIINAYKRAEKDGLYEKMLLFQEVNQDYARTNHKEFFAEMTESIIGMNGYILLSELAKGTWPSDLPIDGKIWGKF